MLNVLNVLQFRPLAARGYDAYTNMDLSKCILSVKYHGRIFQLQTCLFGRASEERAGCFTFIAFNICSSFL